MTSLIEIPVKALKRGNVPHLPGKFMQVLKKELAGEESAEKLESVRQNLRDRCRESLWFFARFVALANYSNAGADVETDLHREMCDRWVKRKHRRFSMWLIPRSHLKTSLWTVAGSLWELINDVDQRILIVNAKLDNAIDIVLDIRSIVETNEVWRWLFPEFCIDKASKFRRDLCKWTTERLDFPNSKWAGRKEGNIQVMSVGASLVSKHYDLMLFDDPVNEDNTTTKPYRDKIHKWYKNSLQLRDNINDTRIRIIGTRWHFDDLYSRILKAESALRKHQRDNGLPIRPNYLVYRRKAIENEKPIWPRQGSKGFTVESLAELKIELGNYIYSCQYDNNPLPEEDASFRYSDIQPIDEIDIPENIVNFMSVDLADEETTRGDFTVITVASFDEDGNMYVRHIDRGHHSILDVIEDVHRLQLEWKCERVGVETTGFQKAIVRGYKRIAAQKGYHIPWREMERGKTSKFKRTLGLQPRVERGDFYYEENIANADWMIEEMTTFPLGTFDDILDTLVDLENLFYGAPQIIDDVKPTDTFDAAYGSLTDLFDSEDEDVDYLSSSLIGVA